MRISGKVILAFSFFLLLLFAFWRISAFAQTPTPTPASSGSICTAVTECADQKIDCSKCIEFLNNKKNEASGKAKTLSSEISATNNQIKLTEARIRATEQKIKELERDIGIAKDKITKLEESINKTTKVLIERIAAVYQVGRIAPWQIFLTANNINDMFNRIKYLRIVQIYDKKNIYAAEQTKVDYQNQKEIFEDKENEARALGKKLGDYNKQLEQEKSNKQELLQITRNDEVRYQRLLAEARAERAVVFGGGIETFLRNVNAGDSVGSIISGASGCSTGTHLHFSVYKGTSVQDPNGYLSGKSFKYSYSEGQYGYYGIISPGGSYPWPVDDPILINQGYGSHGFAQQFYPNGFHDGIDMEGGSLNVKAVRAGKLYGGSYKCSNGTLNYAKVEHDDGLITWYLHIYPN